MTNNENHKMSARQWSLRRMFFWVLFAALICSQVSRIYHSTHVGLNDFRISDDLFKEWISELDPSADAAYSSSASSSRRSNEVESEFDFWISADAATAEQTLLHLRSAVVAKAEIEGWRITGGGEGSERFDLSLFKGATQFKIYCWVMTSGTSFEEQVEEDQKNVFRIMILQIGYVGG